MKKIILFLLMLLLFTSFLHGLEKFYQYYDKGLEYMEKGDWLRAIEEFKSAASLEFEDTKKMRTYGTRFIKYFPHREMGIAYYQLGEFDIAKEELELSIAYKNSNEAQEYLERVLLGITPEQDIIVQEEIIEEVIKDKQEEDVIEEKPEVVITEPEKKEDVRKEPVQIAAIDKDVLKREKEKERAIVPTLKKDEQRVTLEPPTDKVPVGALTYDPSKVTQVGSRLSIAVMPFEAKGQADEFEFTLMEKLVTQLVNLRRFRVIERGAMDQVMNEQALGMSGMVDEETAVEVGKLAGADVIVVGTINIAEGFGKVSARGIDTETAEMIVAKESQTGEPSMSNLESLVENVAILIYNALPLVEGYIVNIDENVLYLDMGSNVGIRKGTKCVAFREGDEIIHPITKEVLGTKVTMLGELIVTQVQEKMSIAKVLAKEGTIKIGDKVVVK
jgi:TolB-like protein